MRQARRDHLANIRNVSGEIADLYADAAKDLAQQAAAAPNGSLNERWAVEYAASLRQRSAELRAGLYETTYQGLRRSASYPAAASGQFWEAVGGTSFRDMFAATPTPDDVLTQLLSGSFYKDGKGLSERIWGAGQEFQNDVTYLIERGIAEHRSAYELARDLEQYVKPSAKRDFDWGKVYPHLRGKKVDFNAQRLARTSINHAYFLSNVKTCQRNPFVTAMHWALSPEHEERQIRPYGPDECDEYAAHDEGLGEGNWKPEEIPTPHPLCLCEQYGVIPQSLEEIGAEIGDWIAGAPNARLDAWYAANYPQDAPPNGSSPPSGGLTEILRSGNSSLQYQANRGRMYSDSDALYHPVTQQAIDRVPKLPVSDDEAFNERYRKACQDLLNEVMIHTELEVGTELSRVYDINMKAIDGYGYRIGSEGHVGIDDPNVFYHAFHNHGSGKTLSFSDIAHFVSRQRQMSITAAGNTGSVYGLFKSKTANRNGYLTYLRNSSQTVIYSANNTDFTLDLLDKIQNGKAERAVIDALDERQTEALQSAMLEAVEKLMKDGDRYGFQYFAGSP